MIFFSYTQSYMFSVILIVLFPLTGFVYWKHILPPQHNSNVRSFMKPSLAPEHLSFLWWHITFGYRIHWDAIDCIKEHLVSHSFNNKDNVSSQKSWSRMAYRVSLIVQQCHERLRSFSLFPSSSLALVPWVESKTVTTVLSVTQKHNYAQWVKRAFVDVGFFWRTRKPFQESDHQTSYVPLAKIVSHACF